MQAATIASLAVTYGTKWGCPQDVRTSSGDVLLGTSSGRNFSKWVGAYLVKKKALIKFSQCGGRNTFFQVLNKRRGGFVELGHFDKHFVKNT